MYRNKNWEARVGKIDRNHVEITHRRNHENYIRPLWFSLNCENEALIYGKIQREVLVKSEKGKRERKKRGTAAQKAR